VPAVGDETLDLGPADDAGATGDERARRAHDASRSQLAKRCRPSSKDTAGA
jgi:hypothetical protein